MKLDYRLPFESKDGKTMAALCIGSNTEDAFDQVSNCLSWLDKQFVLSSNSTIYCTPDITGIGEDYINCVALTAVNYELTVFQRMLKIYERSCGRIEGSKERGEVPIDIDIVIWGDAIVRPKDFSRDYFLQGWNEMIRTIDIADETSDEE